MIHSTGSATPIITGHDRACGKVLIVGIADETAQDLATPLARAGHTTQTFADASALLDSPLPEAPCCVLADIGIPAMQAGTVGALELIERLHHRGEPVPVVFLAGMADVGLCVRAIKAGAVDCLPRPVHAADVLQAIAQALHIDTERRSVARKRHAIARRFDTLTPRERQVMDGVVRGLMNKQIAWELEISEITVKLHRSSLMRKMDLRSVPDLVRASLSLVVPAIVPWATPALKHAA